MRYLFGLVLLIVGLGLGAYSYYPEATEEHVRLAQLARYMPVPHDSDASQAAHQLRTFSPNSPLFGNREVDHTSAANGTSETIPVVVARRQLVRPAHGSGAVIPPFSSDGSISAGQPSANATTARALEVQQELKRVGCYHSYLDGDWGPASRRAMQEFLNKVNASLPVDQPNDILLALLRAHADGSCTNVCADGAVEDGSGRCASKAVVADATNKRDGAPQLITPPRLASRSMSAAQALGTSPQGNSSWLGLGPPSGPRAVLPGRMSVGGPLIAADRAAEKGSSALPDLKPAQELEAIETAAIEPAQETVSVSDPVDREVRRPATVTKKRTPSARKRYSRKTRQNRLMKQAFGEIF